MTLTTEKQSNDSSSLQQMMLDIKADVVAQKSQIDAQKIQIDSLTHENELLREQVKYLLAKRYGRSSEKFVNPNQMNLFDEDELAELDQSDVVPEEGIEIEVPAHKRKRGKRAPLPSYLPTVRVEHTLPDDELVGPNGEQYVKIGEETSKQLDIVPADVRVLEHVRFKYAVKDKEELGVKIAKITGQVIPKSLASSGLLASIVQNKYQYHLPLYRQTQIWKDLEVDIPDNSMSRWMIQLGDAVQPLIDQQLKEIKQHCHVHADETRVTVINEKDAKVDKGSHGGFMWVCTNQNGTVFQYHPTRAGVHAESMLGDFKGYVQSDAYSGYNILFSGEDRKSVGCWAHARRKFTDAAKSSKKQAAANYVIKEIGRLYKIEKNIKEQELNPDEIYHHRQQYSLLILNTLHDFLKSKQSQVMPKSMLGKAIGYVINNWLELFRYTEDGHLAIDNNEAERSIKPFAVGRKNWLFCGNTQGANAGANLYSLIESAKKFNLKPFDYLKYVFEHIREANTEDKLKALLPVNAQQHLPTLK